MLLPSLEELSTVCCDPVKSFSVVSEVKVGVFLEFPHFLYDPLNSPCLKYLPWFLFSWPNSEYCIRFDVKRNYFSNMKGPDRSWERRQEFWVQSRTTGSVWRHVTPGCPLLPKTWREGAEDRQWAKKEGKDKGSKWLTDLMNGPLKASGKSWLPQWELQNEPRCQKKNSCIADLSQVQSHLLVTIYTSLWCFLPWYY